MRPPLLVLACALLAAGTPAPPETTPGPRNAHGAVYDPRDGALLLFGGATPDEVRGDTWQWKGGRWRPLPVTGPAPRTFPAIAFDSARGEVVLFGGNPVLFGDSTPPALLGDTWLLRGEAWSRASVSGPSPRLDAAPWLRPADPVRWMGWPSSRPIPSSGCRTGTDDHLAAPVSTSATHTSLWRSPTVK